jgi:DNA-binding winged helix-turn-helix (wHTH) protein/PAS domain-containing protein
MYPNVTGVDIMLSPDIIHRSRDTSVMLRAGLNLIQQGLSIYSNDLKLIVANQRFKSMFDLPSHLMTTGAAFSDTIRYLAETGEYGDVDDIESFIKARVEQALAFQQHYIERQRANGSWISIEGGPIRQGGWIAVYTDITDVRRQEEMLRSRSDELSGELLDRSEELTRTNRALEATINRLHETQQHLEAAEARIRLAAETTPAHIARLNLTEHYTYSNQRLPLNAANGAADIVGSTARDVLGAEIYQAIAPALRSALSGEARVVEFKVPNEDRQIRAAFTPDTNAANVVTGAYVLSMETTQSQLDPIDRVAQKQDVALFGDWTARLDLMQLIHTPTGDMVTLTLAETALLRLFLTSPNRLISREEMFAAPDIRPGTERALDVRISRLRQKLRDTAKTPQFLRTIYGAGYLFVADVTWQA